MPIIKSRHSLADGIAAFESRGNITRIVHVEDIAPLAMECKELRKEESNGWSTDRKFRRIARIPAITFFDKKHLTNPDGTVNREEMRKFLKSPEGEMFKTVEKGF